MSLLTFLTALFSPPRQSTASSASDDSASLSGKRIPIGDDNLLRMEFHRANDPLRSQIEELSGRIEEVKANIERLKAEAAALEAKKQSHEEQSRLLYSNFMSELDKIQAYGPESERRRRRLAELESERHQIEQEQKEYDARVRRLTGGK